MICEEATEQLGPFLDGELPSAARDDLQAHLATCSTCQAELEALREVAMELGAPPTMPVPDALWTAIERRLDSEPQGLTGPAPSRTRVSTVRPIWLRRVPLALAAAVVLAVGLGVFGPVWTGSSAQASTVDFSVLLNALPLDAQKAFRKFLVLYDAKEGSPVEARRYAPDLNFDLPEVLPGGFRLEGVYLLRFGELAGVAATYDRDGEFLGAVFHPPVDKENFGPHRDYPCVVGRHEGHKVSVGEWKLVHLMDPTTCHCILSRLDEQTELPGVVAAVAPKFPAGASRHGH
jgi:hypothetical protein